MLQKIKEIIGFLIVMTLICFCAWYCIVNSKPKKYVYNNNNTKVELVDSFYCNSKKQVQYIYLVEYKDYQQLIIK